MTPTERHLRFLEVVARGIAKAEEQQRAHLAALRGSRKPRPRRVDLVPWRRPR